MQPRQSPTVKEASAVRYFKKMFVRFGLAKKVKHHDGAIFFRFIWKRVAALVLVLAVLGYGTLVAGAYFFIKYEREFAEIRYFDLFFPHRWDDYREARGDYYIEQALEILDNREAAEGHPFLLLRTGVGLSPENDEGRLQLARYYEQMGRLSSAIVVLESRLEENIDNIEYLQTYLMMLFNDFRDEEIIRRGEEILATEEDGEISARREHMVATAVATAHFYRGNYEEAEAYIADYGLITSKDGFLLQARIDWNRSDEDLAIRRLEEAVDGGRFDHEVFLVLVDFLLQAGREERAGRVALLNHLSDPLSPEPLIGLMQVQHRQGDTDALAAEVEVYFEEFGRDENAMSQLSYMAGQWGNPELAERIYRHCEEAGMNTEAPGYHWVEAHVVAGNYRSALRVAEDWDEVTGEWERGYSVPLQAQLAAAQYGAGNRGEGEVLLTNLFGQGFLRPQHYAVLADRLMTLGETGQARRVLAHVRNNYPHFQVGLSKLIELDLQTHNRGELLANVRRYLSMRQPSTELLERAYSFIGSDLFLFQSEREEVLHSLKDFLGET